ncbi:hypothetical protein OPV22_034875 [Ensete ventricosum]|uniref:Uncharacterized protein n=1 Tax=Ensete ventricosum TaxID=4639 RepID=A0AAV8PKL4_ENSVE|nr:hypothetical protein OPV22_034875 [Ensete ventricosum]
MVQWWSSSSSAASLSKKPNRFGIKKWNAIALWAWGGVERPSLYKRVRMPHHIGFWFQKRFAMSQCEWVAQRLLVKRGLQ